MPTADRAALVPLAVRCFLSQDSREERELVIVDDGAQRIEHLLPPDPRIRYVRLQGPRRSTGIKRNLCCELARGEIIVHWDDDDWSAPGRLSDQVARLAASGAQLTGYSPILFWDTRHLAAYEFEDAPGNISGTSQCYWRWWWRAHPFPDRVVGEDIEFAVSAAGGVAIAPGGGMGVARVHDFHTSPKNLEVAQFRRVARERVPSQFFADLQA